MNHLSFGQPEVRYFIQLAVEENVRWLKVSVNDVELPQVSKTLAYLPKHIQNRFLALGRVILIAAVEQAPEVASSAVLGDDVEITVVLSGRETT